ncbi:MAG: hypothetical protein ACXWLH_05245 [Candidatus Saccharimonadales bacterium]
MADQKPTKKEIEALAKQINEDQKTSYPAEKRYKIPMTFDQVVKKMARTPKPKKK